TRNDGVSWVQTAMGKRAQRGGIAPPDLPKVADCSILYELLQRAERWRPYDRPIDHELDAGLLRRVRHRPRPRETRRHRLFRENVDPIFRGRGSDLSVARVLGTEDRDIDPLPL